MRNSENEEEHIGIGEPYHSTYELMRFFFFGRTSAIIQMSYEIAQKPVSKNPFVFQFKEHSANNQPLLYCGI